MKHVIILYFHKGWLWVSIRQVRKSSSLPTLVPRYLPQRKVERQVKVLIKNLAIFFLYPSKQFLAISFKFSCRPIPPPPPHRVYSLNRYFGRKVQLGAANRRQKLGLVWRNRKKISQIINDYLCLPFFLLIILWYLLYSETKLQDLCHQICGFFMNCFEYFNPEFHSFFSFQSDVLRQQYCTVC